MYFLGVGAWKSYFHGILEIWELVLGHKERVGITFSPGIHRFLDLARKAVGHANLVSRGLKSLVLVQAENRDLMIING